MSPRLSKGVLASSQAPLCLPCRPRLVPSCKCFNPRYQHAEAAQLGKNTPEASLVSPQPNHDDGSKYSAENAAGLRATKLQQLLQQQFAENRRQHMEKLGLRQATQAQAKMTKDSGESHAIDERVIRLNPRRRSQRPKSSVSAASSRKAISRKAAVPTSKDPQKATSRTSSQQVIATEKQDPISKKPLLNIQADVQKLKETLETKDKKKRASQIKLSKLEASKGQAKNVARKVVSGASDASRNVGGVKDRLLSGTISTKNAPVNKVKAGQRDTMTSKKSDQTLVKVPRRTGSGQNPVIETIKAKALELSGNILYVLALIQNLMIAAVEVDQPPVPSLSFGLERVLFK